MRNISIKAIVVVALAITLFGASAAFADSIDVSATGGQYTFSGAVGSVFSTSNLGATGISVSNPPGAPLALGAGAILFTTGTYTGVNGMFNGGGSVSYTNAAACGGLCFSGATTSSQLIGSTILASFTTNWVNPVFAALVGASFPGANPEISNASGSLSIVLSSGNNIGSADYSLVTPEPASLLMLGGGLLAIGGSIRRKLNLI